jgi:DNA-binding transcriptional MocR family regulator
MNGDKVAAIFHNFDSANLRGKSAADAYVTHLRGHMRSGDLPNGTRLPARRILYENNKITYYAIKIALLQLSMEGFLLMKSGQRTVAQYPPIIGHQSKPEVKLVGNYHCKPIRLHTNKPHDIYLKYLQKLLRTISPVDENSISYDLLNYTAVKFNDLYSSAYLTDNFYYSHDLRLMLQATVMSVYQPGTTIVIPAKTYSELPAILQLLGYPYVEIDMDNEGFDVDALAEVCTHHKVAAVFLMSRASYPTTVHTSAKRIKNLFSLREKKGFKIVEVDFFLPWLERKENPLLKLAGKNREEVIYIYPHTFLLKEMSDVTVVAAHTELRQQIRNNLKLIGAKAFKSVAEAMRRTMVHKGFLSAKRKIAELIQEHKMLIQKVFMADDFWQREGLVNDAGLAIFLRPQHMALPKDCFSTLLAEGIVAVNPDWYSGAAEDGLRFDFSHYIGHHDFENKIKLVDQVCRSICITD